MRAAAVLLGIGLACQAASGQARLAGRVVDDNKVAVAGVRVSLSPNAESGGVNPQSPGDAITDETGSFVFEVDTPGVYRLDAQKDGYFLIEDQQVELKEGHNELTLVLNPVREVYESIDVAYSPPAIDLEETSAEQSITGNDVLFVPYPSSHSLRNAMRIMPGPVVQDATGEIHFNGGAANQTLWTLDGFNVTDPLTGRFDSRLNVEAARSVKLASGRYPAEFGKGSAGVLAIDTHMGNDEFRYSATNFVPGVETRKGELTFGEWRPRANFSGPIAKGRAWFFNSLSTQYTNNIVEELPLGEDRTAHYRLSNLLRTQVNLTSSNILYTGFLVNALSAPRSGLGALDPHETTVDRRERQYLFHVKDQLYFDPGAVIEVGYAANRTFGREIPQGHDLYVFTPNGRRGNFFIDAERWGRRDQWLANAILPSFEAGGSHRLKAGIDMNRVGYRQDVRRTGFERRRLDGTLRRRVVFGGDGSLERTNFESAWYLQDTWKPAERLVVDFGVRQDWDSLVGEASLAPRIAASWSPPGWEDTKFSGGYAVLHDATTLQTFTRHLDQHSITTEFGPGGQPVADPTVTLFTLDRTDLKRPRYRNWSAAVEQRLPGDFHMRANYLRRRGSDGFTFVNMLPEISPVQIERAAAFEGREFDAIFGLRNFRRDKIDSAEFTVRKTFRKQAVWMASYTRSRARSNSVLDISIDTPVSVLDNQGPMPWDSPNRLLSWGYFPLTKKYALGYMLEWRSGFPFSVEDDEGRLVEAVNSRRLPDFFELNLSIERRFRFRGYYWALRVGAVNVTDSQNPTLVNNNISSPNFLQYFGGTRRAYVTRIRLLGKVN